MFGIVPPVGRGLDVESVWFELLEELFGPVGEGGGGIGGAYEGEGALMFGICEYGECIFEGIESIIHTIINISIDLNLFKSIWIFFIDLKFSNRFK